MSSATSGPRSRLHEHTTLRAARFSISLPSPSSSCSLLALRFHRVPIHTGNQAFASRFSPNSPCTRLFRYFAPLPTHSDLCLSADRCTGNRMHLHPNRIPQHTTFQSFIPKNTPRMVREPHRTHGNKTRICSFTDSRTTICAPCHTPTPISTASPELTVRSYEWRGTRPAVQGIWEFV